MRKQVCLEQQRAVTRAQLADYRRRAAAEVAAAQQRAGAEAERQLAAAVAASGGAGAPPPPLGQGHAAASVAYREYLAKHEAVEQCRAQGEAFAAQRHAAAVATKHAELARIQQEVRLGCQQPGEESGHFHMHVNGGET
jgi:hypothetical protein